MADKGATRDGTHKLTEFRHPSGGFKVDLLGLLEEPLVVLVVDLLHAREVAAERGAREQAIKTLAVFNMVFTIQKHPVGLSEKLVGRIDDTGFGKSGRIEDLPRRVASGRDNNEPMVIG